VEKLRVGGPNAQAAAKRLLDDVANLPIEDAVAMAPEHIARQRASDEAREGFAAFLEKRSASWVGGDD
jgi:methylglutaconyl-CoA hydratase